MEKTARHRSLIRSDAVRHGTATLIEFAPYLYRAARYALNLHSAEPGDDVSPLPYGSRGDSKRPRNIRGPLEVSEDFTLKHEPPFTTVKTQFQPQYQAKGLTLVAMDRHMTIADRLKAAMKDAGISSSQLARECGVTPAAVNKWRNGGRLSADNLAAAARALGVNPDWLRTGKLPRERQNGTVERDVDRVLSLLTGLQGPLSELLQAISKLHEHQEQERKRRRA